MKIRVREKSKEKVVRILGSLTTPKKMQEIVENSGVDQKIVYYHLLRLRQSKYVENIQTEMGKFFQLTKKGERLAEKGFKNNERKPHSYALNTEKHKLKILNFQIIAKNFSIMSKQFENIALNIDDLVEKKANEKAINLIQKKFNSTVEDAKNFLEK